MASCPSDLGEPESPRRIFKFIALTPVFWLVAVFLMGTASPAFGIPDTEMWNWIMRLVGVCIAVPACWFAVGANAASAAKANELCASIHAMAVNLLCALGVLTGLFSLTMVFVKDTDWVARVVYQPSLRATAVVLFMIVPAALVACFFKRIRMAGFTALLLSSVICSFTLWVYSLYVAATISIIWMIIGVLAGGLGVIPIALIASCVTAQWSPVLSIIVASAIVLILRYGALWGMSHEAEAEAVRMAEEEYAVFEESLPQED